MHVCVSGDERGRVSVARVVGTQKKVMGAGSQTAVLGVGSGGTAAGLRSTLVHATSSHHGTDLAIDRVTVDQL